MWNQTPKWDVYVMGHLPRHQKYLELRGWLTRGKMEELMEKAENNGGSAEGCAKVIRDFGKGPRTDWTFNDEAMFSTDDLFSYIFINNFELIFNLLELVQHFCPFTIRLFHPFIDELMGFLDLTQLKKKYSGIYQQINKSKRLIIKNIELFTA